MVNFYVVKLLFWILWPRRNSFSWRSFQRRLDIKLWVLIWDGIPHADALFVIRILKSNFHLKSRFIIYQIGVVFQHCTLPTNASPMERNLWSSNMHMYKDGVHLRSVISPAVISPACHYILCALNFPNWNLKDGIRAACNLISFPITNALFLQRISEFIFRFDNQIDV